MFCVIAGGAVRAVRVAGHLGAVQAFAADGAGVKIGDALLLSRGRWAARVLRTAQRASGRGEIMIKHVARGMALTLVFASAAFALLNRAASVDCRVVFTKRPERE